MKKISDEDIVSAYNSLCVSRNHLNSVAHNLVTGIQDFGIALRELDQRVPEPGTDDEIRRNLMPHLELRPVAEGDGPNDVHGPVVNSDHAPR